MNKYYIKEFEKKYGHEDDYLNFLLKEKLHDNKCNKCSSEKIYPIKGRKAFECSNKHKISPLANTMFNKSSTPLTYWFYVMHLFFNSENEINIKEIERQLGVTYKTAWRMSSQIKKLNRKENYYIKFNKDK